MQFSRNFWFLPQKPPGRHEGAARRHISVNPVSGFWFELLGGGLNSARRCFIIVAVLCCFLEFHHVLRFHWDIYPN